VGATPAAERVWRYVTVAEGCWLWTGCLSTAGYAKIGKGSRGEGWIGAHRVVYEALVGPIPDGLVIDHLCRNRACVNPAHMEVVTQCENTLRGESPMAQQKRRTHCPEGHAYTPDNTVVDKQGKRRCRTCKVVYLRNYRARRREETA
jgi:HNH endonuclease